MTVDRIHPTVASLLAYYLGCGLDCEIGPGGVDIVAVSGSGGAVVLMPPAVGRWVLSRLDRRAPVAVSEGGGTWTVPTMPVSGPLAVETVRALATVGCRVAAVASRVALPGPGRGRAHWEVPPDRGERPDPAVVIAEIGGFDPARAAPVFGGAHRRAGSAALDAIWRGPWSRFLDDSLDPD